MDYIAMILAIKKYLKQVFGYRISFDLKTGKPFSIERNRIMSDALPGLDKKILEPLLQQMYEDGYVTKDDGQLVHFSTAFVFG